ncbi:DUF4133 domain-containing protein [Pedobacter cryophilus]|uniref:DUF4133 domain-containing protein n=1 Tax=Pedobacter cryophilus TaxID=2571271 RepID=A0A4U1C0V0_9SPHI|nr:DUF4133 domain-containing protein [Pedobacter cryophilus]TKB99162.1 DUF4133 domain-containing protein [Pedobacter cryophilus]
MATVYQINKGINKPIEFKGLKAQYIMYLGIGLVVLLLLFAIMYMLGVHLLICLMIAGILGSALFLLTFRLSHQYGEHGLLKFLAKRKIPTFLKSSSRQLFIQLTRKEVCNVKSN